MQTPSESGSAGIETIEKKPQPLAPEPSRVATDVGALEEKKLAIRQNLESSFKRALTNIAKGAGLQCDEPVITVVDEENIGREFCFRIEARINRSAEELIPPNGRREVASIRRQISYRRNSREWIVYRMGMDVSPDLQGKGKSIGSQITKAEENAYREQGISQILVHAGPPVGIYFSAREGFDFAKEGEKDKANAKFLSLILDQKLEHAILKDSKGNIWPKTPPLSAYEMSQIRAFDYKGDEIRVMANREKESDEISGIPERFLHLCCPEDTSEKVKKYLEEMEFMQTTNLTSYLSLTSPEDRKKSIQKDFEYEQKSEHFQNRLRERLGEEGRLEYLNLLKSPGYIEGFLNGLEELEQGKMIDKDGEALSLYHQVPYSLGKAFFLDMGPKGTFLNGWDGMKRLLPSIKPQ